MSVADGDDVEGADAAVPQIGCDDVFADVEPLDEEEGASGECDWPGCAESLGEETHFDAELGSAGEEMQVAAGVVKVGERGGERAGSGGDGGRSEGAQESEARKVS
jgi:hypothetical protein